MAYGYNLEAEYQDGYVHSEAEFDDVSPYNSSRNIFADILKQAPVEEHGKMVRWSMIPDNGGNRFDVDWTLFPDDAKVIYKREMQMHVNPTPNQLMGPHALYHYFGYEYHELDGTKVKMIIKADPTTGKYQIVEGQ